MITYSAHGRGAGLAEAGTGSQQRWLQPEVVVTLDSSLSQVGLFSESSVLEAFQTWNRSGANLPQVVFERAQGLTPSLTPDGINAVMVAPIDFEGHEMDLAITVGFSNPKTGEITEADIVINSRHTFTMMDRRAVLGYAESCNGTLDPTICGQTYDLQNVLTHEVGHFWGLGENYKDSRATMFSCTSACEIHKRELSDGDRAVVTSLYLEPGGGCGGAHIAPRPVASWPALLLAIFSSLLLLRRRRRAETGRG